MLFSIETTTAKYNVTNLWRSYFCAGFCIVTHKLLKEICNEKQEHPLIFLFYFFEVALDSLNPTEFEPFKVDYELLGFALLGIVNCCSLLNLQSRKGLIIGILIVIGEKLIVFLTMLRRTFTKMWIFE